MCILISFCDANYRSFIWNFNQDFFREIEDYAEPAQESLFPNMISMLCTYSITRSCSLHAHCIGNREL